MMENVHFKKKLATIEDHHNKQTIEDQGCSWGTPLKKYLGVFFVLIRRPFFLYIQNHVASIN